jgi:arylsulfatase A-like enzyme
VRRFRILALSLVGLLGCDDEGARSGATEPGPEPPPAVGDVETPAVAFRTHFDLAAHVERAEIYEGDALVMDHGVRGGAKYTLGGWQTRTGPSHDVDGTPALIVEGVTAKVVLPVARSGSHHLALRVRALGDPRLTIYVDDETVHHARLPRDEFSVVRVALPELSAGERYLALRVPSTGFAPGVGRAALALDWVRLTRGSDPPSEAEPPRGLVGATDEGRTLRLPRDVAAGWALDVPSGARLRGTVRGPGSVVVRALTDAAAPRDLGTFGVGELDAELSALVGTVARVELGAAGDAVEIARPRVVVPGEDPELRPAPRAQNLIVYLVDTLRADKLHAYRPSSRVRTPGLDAWARTATVLGRGQSQENWTKPSVATLLSGLMPWQHHATADAAVLPASVTMLSELLRERGFHTGAFIANGYVSDAFGFRQGWATYRNYIREGRRTQARFVAADVLEWLDARPDDRPFFLYVHTIDPHVPYMPPPDVLASYDPEPYDGPVDFSRDRETLEKIKSGALTVNARDRTRLEALYDGEITYHDVHFHSIVQALERRGLADDTVVVFTSDHGEEFFDHGSVGHGHSVWQELLHVPLLVRVPGLTEETATVDDAVGLVDVMPTVLEALGQNVPDGLAGRSFLDLLRGARPDAPRVTVSGFMGGWRTVVTGRHKLIHRTAARTMVYDLGADPGETRDLAAERPVTLRWLRGLLGLALAGELDGGRAAAVHEAETTRIDDVTAAQLRELGYVGAARPD